MIGTKISVWLGAFSDYWCTHTAGPGDAWVASTILEVGDDGNVKAQRDANKNMIAWIKPEHQREFVEGDE